MTKAQLLAEITSTYLSVGTPVQQDDTDNVKWYKVNIVETGLSAKSKKPVAYRRNMSFFVYKEGTGDEAAYYDRDELNNTVNSDLTGDSSLYAIGKIFNNSVIQNRVQAAIGIAAQNILDEENSITNHAKRLKWASEALLNPTRYTATMSMFVAQNPTIQAAGGIATDNDIKFVINSYIDKLAEAAGF